MNGRMRSVKNNKKKNIDKIYKEGAFKNNQVCQSCYSQYNIMKLKGMFWLNILKDKQIILKIHDQCFHLLMCIIIYLKLSRMFSVCQMYKTR